MLYRVRARYIDEKLNEFYGKLTDGTIGNQLPDGEEMVASMQRAKITAPGIIEWFETCYCSSPLKHERETVYDYFLTEISTEVVEDYGVIDGESFWVFMQAMPAVNH